MNETTFLAKGRTLQNKYRVIEPRAGGGFGRVYKVEEIHPHLGSKQFALKQLIRDESWDEDTYELAKRAFMVEAKTLRHFQHESVPRVHDAFEEIESLFLVMDFIEGENLQERFCNTRPSLDEANLIIDKLLRIVHALHSASPQIIHRDIKPANIIIEDSRVWLVDFGIARNAHYKTVVSTIGSSYFSPPEQARGLSTTVRGDIYSIGATYYFLLTGERPPDSSLRDGSLESTGLLNPQGEIPELIFDVVRKAMSMNQNERFGSAQEMRIALQKAKVKLNDVANLLKAGKMLVDQREWNKAIAKFDQAVKLDPRSSSALFGLGHCYYETGMDQQAIEFFNKGLRIEKGNFAVYYYKALAYERLGDNLSALTNWNRAVDLNDDSFYRWKRLDVCLKLAEEDLEILVQRPGNLIAKLESRVKLANLKLFDLAILGLFVWLLTCAFFFFLGIGLGNGSK